LIRVDLHVHSSASFDCLIEPERVALTCRKLGLSPVFLTDHDSIDGALELRGADVRVVVGEEVATADGELIGLFLKDAIPAGLPATEAVRRIKDQGGLVYLEHPYDSSRRRLREEAIESVADLIDIVEVFNGRSDEKANRRAKELCATLGAAPGAGSDAHTVGEIGSVYIEMDDFVDATSFLAGLHKARIVKGRNKFVLTVEAKLRPNIRRR
jgi:predicted metal-dependent phosphoesterase TrpH